MTPEQWFQAARHPPVGGLNAHALGAGALNGLAGGLGHLLGQVRQPMPWIIDQNGNGARLEITNDVPKLLEDEVRKHLPWGLPLHVVQATRAETHHGYSVGIWVMTGDLHEAKLIGEAVVDDYVLRVRRHEDWRAIMLNDLADDIARRAA